jgi:hypothetical protein
MFPRVRTSAQGWFVFLFFSYFFWKHWDDPVIRMWAYFYGACMIISLIWIILKIRRDDKELKRQIETGELWQIKPPPKL